MAWTARIISKFTYSSLIKVIDSTHNSSSSCQKIASCKNVGSKRALVQDLHICKEGAKGNTDIDWMLLLLSHICFNKTCELDGASRSLRSQNWITTRSEEQYTPRMVFNLKTRGNEQCPLWKVLIQAQGWDAFVCLSCAYSLHDISVRGFWHLQVVQSSQEKSTA